MCEENGVGVSGVIPQTPMVFAILANLGVPRPVTGSHPVLAGNPAVLQDGLLPSVMSFRIPGFAYRKGFKNPIALFDFVRSRSFSRAMTEAKMGALAEVP